MWIFLREYSIDCFLSGFCLSNDIKLYWWIVVFCRNTGLSAWVVAAATDIRHQSASWSGLVHLKNGFFAQTEEFLWFWKFFTMIFMRHYMVIWNPLVVFTKYYRKIFVVISTYRKYRLPPPGEIFFTKLF